MTSNRDELKKETLAKLAELGGKAFKDEDILRQGDKLILPIGMNEKQAMEFLARKIKEQEETTAFSKTFKYRPWDGAYCTYNAFKKAFGAVAHNTQTIQGLFGSHQIPPQLITIKTGPDTESQIPWGELEIPYLPGVKFTLASARDEELGIVFSIHVEAPKKLRFEIEGLFVLIEEELKNHSLYKGKAIDGRTEPEFLDLSGVDRNKVVYSQDVMTQLEASVWSLIRYDKEHRDLGLPLKRAVLVHGPYGTGKTLSAFLTAQEAVENGWTFLYARPGKDDLDEVMQTARMYQPAVVFFEDMDVIASPDAGEDGISQMLDLFDGITAKGTEIVAILTTNHPDKIHKGMVRPGRLDAVIEIAALDHPGVEALVKVSVPPSALGENIEWERVGDAMDGFMPAYVKEAADRAVRYALARHEGRFDDIVLDTEDFINAANGLRPQLELMEGAKEHATRDSLSVATEKVVATAVKDTMAEDFGLSLRR